VIRPVLVVILTICTSSPMNGMGVGMAVGSGVGVTAITGCASPPLKAGITEQPQRLPCRGPGAHIGGHVLHAGDQRRLNFALEVEVNRNFTRRSIAPRQRHVLLFSTDLSLSAAQIVDYYSLRFQIEFTFHDAKQYWGLEDFMNVSEQAITNAVNFAFLMINLSAVLLHSHRQREPDFSVLDLKCHFRARR